DDDRLLAQRYDHHLRPRPRGPAKAAEGIDVRLAESRGQRNAAALGAHAHHRVCVLDGARAPGRRGDPSVRAGDDVRRSHRYVQLDLRRAGHPVVDRAQVAARRWRPRSQSAIGAGHTVVYAAAAAAAPQSRRRILSRTTPSEPPPTQGGGFASWPHSSTATPTLRTPRSTTIATR